MGPNHKLDCNGNTWRYSGEGYNRVKVCACGAEDHAPGSGSLRDWLNVKDDAAYCCHKHHGPGPLLRMLVCSTCGNKRCPKASDCSLGCTNSNEAGQPGSVYVGTSDAIKILARHDTPEIRDAIELEKDRLREAELQLRLREALYRDEP